MQLFERIDGLARTTASIGSTESERNRSAKPNTDDQRLPIDHVFKVVSNERRREIIRQLRDAEGVVTVGELAEQIAAEENDTTVQHLSSYERKRVYVGLYQNHLPMMDELNVVEYDDGRKTVELREAATDLEPYLDETNEPGSRHMTELASAVTATSIFFGVLQVGFFAVVSAPVWIAFGVVAILGVATSDWYDDASSTYSAAPHSTQR